MTATPTLRLTKSDREGVLRRAMSDCLKKETEALAKEEDAVAVAAYKHLFPAKVRAIADQLPDTWVRTDKCLRLTFGFKQVRLTVLEAVKVPSANGYGCHQLGTILDEKINARFEAWLAKHEAFRERRRNVEVNLAALLERATTLKQLSEMWPEGSEFYKHLTPRVAAQVPAVQVQDINAMLGLKTAA